MHFRITKFTQREARFVTKLEGGEWKVRGRDELKELTTGKETTEPRTNSMKC